MHRDIKDRKKETGGLHIRVGASEKIEVHHKGDVLNIYCQGKNGFNKYDISFVGSKDFKIILPRNDENNKI